MDATRQHTHSPRRTRLRAIATVMLSGLLLLGVLSPAAQAVRPGSWTPLAPAPFPRHESSYVQLDGLFHLLGGKWKQHNVYDPGSDEWSKAAPMPVKVNRVQAVTVGGKIYMIGGMVKWKSPTIESKAVLIYDPDTNSWSRGRPMPRPRGAGGVAVFKGKIYYAGGIADSRSVKWFDVYNPATNKWRKLPNMPIARQHFQATVANGNFYAFGGANYATRQLVKKSARFNFRTGNWRMKGVRKPLVLTEGFAAAKLAGRIVLFGGVGATGAKSVVQAYDPRTNRWVKWAQLPTPRHATQAATCQGGAYIAAGSVATGRHPSARQDVFFLGASNPC
jgi:N-acetylneuraminic acid mutarotase